MSTDNYRWSAAEYLDRVTIPVQLWFTPEELIRAELVREALWKKAGELLTPLRRGIQKVHRKLVHVVVTILVSQPGAKAQRLLNDISSDLFAALPPQHVTFSIIVPLHDYYKFHVSAYGRAEHP